MVQVCAEGAQFPARFELWQIKLAHYRKSSSLDFDQRLEAAAVAIISCVFGKSLDNRGREQREEIGMKKVNLTRTIIIGGSAALAAAVLFAGLVVAPRSVTALPAYAQKEGKACGYCHANPAGGGERNARGKQYEANGHSFKK